MESGGIIGIIFGIVVVMGGGVYVSMQKKTNNTPYDLTGSQYYGKSRSSTQQAYPSRYKFLYGYGNSDSSSSSSSYNNSYKRTGYRRTGYRRHGGGGSRIKRVTKNKTQRL